MEKLIPLLNEKTWKEWVLESNSFWEDWLFLKWHPEVMIKEEKLISKKYWFIKWLIDNYYIELPMWLWVVKNYDKESWLFNYFSDYESLLMLLSVQENPIEFLIKLIQ